MNDFDIVAVELEREIYNRTDQPENAGCSGCGCLPIILFFAGMIIFQIVGGLMK